MNRTQSMKGLGEKEIKQILNSSRTVNFISMKNINRKPIKKYYIMGLHWYRLV